jgi:predicted transcriptional regulator
MTGKSTAQELIGKTIKEVFKHAEEVADLHGCLTSPRGSYFRLRLLQALEVPSDEATIERNRVEAGVQEYHRHLHKLLRFGLVSEKEMGGQRHYTRTDLGERAVNAVRELERGVTHQEAQAIDSAALGPNSVRLFLRFYGGKGGVGGDHVEVRYTPAEVGRVSLFLPRIIEGISAVDKLNDAGLVAYRDDGYIYMPAVKARNFYRYLRELWEIIKTNPRR